MQLADVVDTLSLDAVRSLGSETLDRATSVRDRLSSGIAERTRRRGDEGERGEERDDED